MTKAELLIKLDHLPIDAQVVIRQHDTAADEDVIDVTYDGEKIVIE